MIPQTYLPAVTRALDTTFGVSQYDDISQITKGHTASHVYRITVRGTDYLMKIITRTEDPTRHYTCMRSAAEAGLAPAVRYTSIPDRLSITNFIDATALTPAEALLRMPSTLRALHALPPFERAPFNTTCTFLLQPGPALDAFLQKLRAATVLPPSETETFFACYEELAAAYAMDMPDAVSCHNDLFKPDNILYDGRGISFIDWEAAFRNDRYADLAVVSNQLVTSDEDEIRFLTQYLRQQPTEYHRARLHHMQLLSHVFYTMAFLYLGAMAGPVDWTVSVPTFHDYQRRMWAGEIDLADKPTKILSGRVYYQHLIHEIQQPRYTETLRILATIRPTPSPH